MKRKIIVLILVLAAVLNFASASYIDISDGKTAAAADVLTALDIVDGFPDGGYHPEESLTRAQFCKLAVTVMDLEDEAASYTDRMLFSDVKAAHWAFGYVNLAYSKGVVTGYGQGRFGPEDKVTYAQAVTILLRILGYSQSQIGSQWPGDYLSYADKLGLDASLNLGADTALSRGQAAILLTQMLKTKSTTGYDYYTTLADKTVTAAVLLSVDSTADNGEQHRAKFYVTGETVNRTTAPTLGAASSTSSSDTAGTGTSASTAASTTVSNAVSSSENGSVAWYAQAQPLSWGLVGYGGSLLLNEDDEVIAFLPDDDQYTTVSGTLLSADDVSDSGVAHCVKLYTNGAVAWYPAAGTLSAASVGEAGELLLNAQGKAVDFLASGDKKYDYTLSAILLSNDDKSDEGEAGCAKLLIDGAVKWYPQYTPLDEGLVGCSGALIVDSEGYVSGFSTDGEKYELEEGILISSDYSGGGEKHVLRLWNGRKLKYYEKAGDVSDSLVGCSGTAVLNGNGYAVAFVADDGEAQYTVEEGLLFLDADETADNGDTRQAAAWNGKEIVYYPHARSFDYDGHGTGSALTDEDDKLTEFIEDDCASEYVSAAPDTENPNFITGDIRVPNSSDVVYHDASGKLTVTSWSEISALVEEGMGAWVYYDNDGDIALVYFDQATF